MGVRKPTKEKRTLAKRFVKNKTKNQSFVTNHYETYLYSPEPEPGSIERKKRNVY